MPSSKKRRPYRAPLGMPKGREDWRVGTGISMVVHIAVLVLLFLPLALTGDVLETAQGAGGPGPAGGGGGGMRGTGALKAEFLQFVRVAPPPPPTPTSQPKVQPPPPPTPQVLPTPQPQLDTKLPVPTMTAGIGGGTGSDNTSGSGPGSGGGVGTGIGTGRGSSVGPGTGGGNQANYAPTPIEMFIPPLPTPASVKGFHVIVEFDVDETGRVLSLNFTPTPDRGYNRRLSEVFKSYRFRAGTRPDGTPIRMKGQIGIDLP
jgi:protein TonB